MKRSRGPRIRREQRDYLASYMLKNPNLAHRRLGTNYTEKKWRMQWGKLAEKLNSIPGGCYKTLDNWIKAWNDQRVKAKKRGDLYRSQIENGDREGLLANTMSPISEKILASMGGRKFYAGVATTQEFGIGPEQDIIVEEIEVESPPIHENIDEEVTRNSIDIECGTITELEDFPSQSPRQRSQSNSPDKTNIGISANRQNVLSTQKLEKALNSKESPVLVADVAEDNKAVNKKTTVKRKKKSSLFDASYQDEVIKNAMQHTQIFNLLAERVGELVNEYAERTAVIQQRNEIEMRKAVALENIFNVLSKKG